MMNKKTLFTTICIASMLILSVTEAQLTPPTSTGNYNLTYHCGATAGLFSEELHVSVPASLYDYYSGKTIKIIGDSDYSKLVTPDAVTPIAKNLQELTRNSPRSDEAFANAVLNVIHQIPYQTDDVKYPIETLAENNGKCDSLSLLAASIMKAGGLDVVLLYFKDVHHINIGVYLEDEPQTSLWGQKPTGYKLNGKTYWIAECTPSVNWKVGEAPPLLVEERPCIISLEATENSSPAKISSQLTKPHASSISVNLSSDEKNRFTISGSITPAFENATVSVYFSKDRISFNSMETKTDRHGEYSFVWSFNLTGTYYIRTSWSGNEEYAGADSESLMVFVGFPQTSIELDGLGYYYTFTPVEAANQELKAMQGVEDFLDFQVSGPAVYLTGEFIVLENEHDIIKTESKTVTHRKMDLLASIFGKIQSWRHMQMTTPVDVPAGSVPVRVPDDFEQTTNNQFSFFLWRSSESSYSCNIRGVDDYEMGELDKCSQTAILNTTDLVTENTWYKVQARITQDGVTATVYDSEGKSIESISDDNANSSLAVMLTNNKDRVVAFKNLSVTIPEQTQQTQRTPIMIKLLALGAIMVLFLGAVSVKRRCFKSASSKQDAERRNHF
ncbi:MAG: hypothetical protein NWE92_13660 [Candidatus Bathyarchaeota archaeon]|nr:hypothetical protein [Candidatus Bathyarchaeota archaeon]